jgi:hypothetical protein
VERGDAEHVRGCGFALRQTVAKDLALDDAVAGKSDDAQQASGQGCAEDDDRQ